MLFAPFLAAWLAAIVTFFVAALCIAWSPFAALACARIARRKGLSARRYAIYGAIYSVLLFLPWRHLIRRMRGEPVSRASVRNAYEAVYAVAAILLICNIVYLIGEIIEYPYHYDFFSTFAVLTVAASLALGAGMVSISRANRRTAEREMQGDSCGDVASPDLSYIAPFAWAWASMLIGSSLWCIALLAGVFNVFFR